MARAALIVLLLLLLTPVPLVHRVASRAISDIERRDLDLRARDEALRFAAFVRERIEADPRGWIDRSDPARIAVSDEGPVLPPLSDPTRVRALESLDPVDALQALDAVISADPRAGADEGDDAGAWTAAVIGRVEAAIVLESLGHAGKAARLRAQAVDIAARAAEILPEVGWLRRLAGFSGGGSEREIEAWVEEVESRPATWTEMTALLRCCRDAGRADLGSRARARASWPAWSRAVGPVETSELRVVHTARGWFSCRGFSFRPGPALGECAVDFGRARGIALSLSPSASGEAVAGPLRADGVRIDLPHGTALRIELPRRRLLGPLDAKTAMSLALFVYATLGVALVLAIACQMRRARRLLQARDDLIAQVAHELRTPLSVLRLYSDSLRQDRVRPEATSEYLQAIAMETDRLGTLVDRMVRSIRGDPAGLPSSSAHAARDLSALVREAVSRFERAAAQRGGTIAATYDHGVETRVDPRDLGLALDVVLDNALRYGGDPPRVEVTVSAVAGRAVVRVLDRGPGIGRGEEKRLFERFVRGEAARGHSRGAGMGLYLARQVVRAAGGDVTLRNARGCGALAEIVLPAEPEEEVRS